MSDETEQDRYDINIASYATRCTNENAALRSQIDAANGREAVLRSALTKARKQLEFFMRKARWSDIEHDLAVYDAALSSDGSAVAANDGSYRMTELDECVNARDGARAEIAWLRGPRTGDITHREYQLSAELAAARRVVEAVKHARLSSNRAKPGDVSPLTPYGLLVEALMELVAIYDAATGQDGGGS